MCVHSLPRPCTDLTVPSSSPVQLGHVSITSGSEADPSSSTASESIQTVRGTLTLVPVTVTSGPVTFPVTVIGACPPSAGQTVTVIGACPPSVGQTVTVSNDISATSTGKANSK